MTIWRKSFYYRSGKGKGQPKDTWRHRYSGRIVKSPKTVSYETLRKKAGLSKTIESRRQTSYGSDRRNIQLRREQRIPQQERESFRRLRGRTR